jgi:hypothetical protein
MIAKMSTVALHLSILTENCDHAVADDDVGMDRNTTMRGSFYDALIKAKYGLNLEEADDSIIVLETHQEQLGNHAEARGLCGRGDGHAFVRLAIATRNFGCDINRTTSSADIPYVCLSHDGQKISFECPWDEARNEAIKQMFKEHEMACGLGRGWKNHKRLYGPKRDIPVTDELIVAAVTLAKEWRMLVDPILQRIADHILGRDFYSPKNIVERVLHSNTTSHLSGGLQRFFHQYAIARLRDDQRCGTAAIHLEDSETTTDGDEFYELARHGVLGLTTDMAGTPRFIPVEETFMLAAKLGFDADSLERSYGWEVQSRGNGGYEPSR